MAGETVTTVIGNLTADPELRFTPSGSAVANFTIASTPRTFDRQTNDWKDGETLFLRCNVWRESAENVAETLTKGTRVIAQGRLKSRSYDTKEGEKRTVMELEVDEVGPSLRYASAKVARTQRSNSGNGGTGGNGGGAQQGGHSNQGNQNNTAWQQQPADDPWGAPAAAGAGRAGGWGNGPESEPPF
ncbi:single-stranded DNA-binding protein [Arthrobacter sp. MDB2-24]